jgi:hypothetical protein
MGNCHVLFLGLCALSALPLGVRGEERGDVLLLRHPEKLVVYNQYQVTLSSKDRPSLKPYAPLRIVRNDATLPDGFTHTMHVESGSDQFYLLKEDDGNLAPASKPILIKNVEFLAETVRVMRARTVALISPEKDNRRFLTKDQVLFLQFRHRDLVFVTISAATPSYGWVSLLPKDRGKTWEYVHTTPSVAVEFSASIIEGVRTRLQAANTFLDSLFARLNAENGERRSPPAWRLSVHRSRLLCELEPASQARAFHETTNLLAKELETILLGTSVTVSVSPGKIALSLNGS